jgi:hypothetical protein
MVLWSIGETPVNSLAVEGIRDVALAELVLDRVTREVLSKGWDFNTDSEWEIVPDANDNLLVPANALRLDPTLKYLNYVERDNDGTRMMWDKENHTWDFDETVKFNIVWAFDFDECPETARNYIATRAARLFQAGAMGDELIYKFTEVHEAHARAEFRRAHALTRDANLLSREPAFHRQFNPRR